MRGSDPRLLRTGVGAERAGITMGDPPRAQGATEGSVIGVMALVNAWMMVLTPCGSGS